MISPKNKLIKQDMIKWTKNTLLFSSPAIIAFLTVLQGGGSFEFALGAGYSALTAAIIDLLKKFIAENEYEE